MQSFAAQTASSTMTAASPQIAEQLDDTEREESLVIQTSFLGDAVLTTPLIAELGTRGPVDVVVTPASAPLLANNPAIRNLFAYDKRGDQSFSGLWRATRQVKGRRISLTASRRNERRARQIAYLAQGSWRSAMLALLAGYPERIGFSTSPGRMLYTQQVLYRDDLHHAERLWRLAFPNSPPGSAAEGANADDRLLPRLYPGAAEHDAVDAALSGHEIRSSLIALAPGSVWATKRWPYYADLARRLVDRFTIAIVGSVADRTAAMEIATVAPGRVIDATGALTPLGSAELIGRARVLVTNDSLPQHIASAMRTPTVSIFGPTVPAFGFGPLAPGSRTAGHATLACRPCHHHGPERCPLGHWRCMRELDVAQVERLITSITG
ncbi:MAG: glycosyltransferase family 9 protein [Gemmatimonadaceae bacterium]